jgi:hypothetical protein
MVAITADLYTDVLGGLQREAAYQLVANFGAALARKRGFRNAGVIKNCHQKAV